MKFKSRKFLTSVDLKMQFHRPMIENGHLIFWFPEERVGSWVKSIFPMPNSDQVQNYSLNFKSLSQGLFFQHSIYPGEWIDSGWTWRRQRTTDCLLHTTEPFWWRFTNKCTVPAIAVKWVKSSRAQDRGLYMWQNEVTCNHRTQSCASRLHLQSYFSKRRSNVVRTTLDSTTCAKSPTQKQLAIAAAAVDLRGRDMHRATCARQDGRR